MKNKADVGHIGFFRIKNDLINYFGPALGVYGIAIYNVLKMHENQTTKACFPSINKICKLTGASRTTVQKILKLLVKLELIEITHHKSTSGDYSSNSYKFLIPQVPVPEHIVKMFPDKFSPKTNQSQTNNCADLAPNGDSVCTQGVHKSAQPSDVLPQSISNTTQSTSREEVVREIATNKTNKKNEFKETNLTYNKAVNIQRVDSKSSNIAFKEEHYESIRKEFTEVFPALTEFELRVLFEEAFEKKNNDPVKTIERLNEILKMVKKKKNIKNPYGYLRTMIKKDYKFDINYFKNKTILPFKKSTSSPKKIGTSPKMNPIYEINGNREIVI